MNINDIQDLIKFVAKAGVNEVEIEKGFQNRDQVRLHGQKENKF